MMSTSGFNLLTPELEARITECWERIVTNMKQLAALSEQIVEIIQTHEALLKEHEKTSKIKGDPDVNDV